jgi:hypothetical protein
VIYAVGVAVIVITGTLTGAVLKDEAQRRKVRALVVGEDTSTTGVEGDQTQQISKGDEQVGQQQPGEQLKPHAQQEQKRIQNQIENLEARKKELLMKKGEIVGKVEVLRERIRMTEEKERMKRELGQGKV